ncbi:aminopeptidase P family protein [Oceanobacillus piezotolerans]|uniref:Aminopeptidase P family protein n=1 Tax=Oceanobacillus piezotolerans TaxID=2448030 RepID=A0A498DEA4_9BACI|nr:Xaa-Pro peptidase family protein [Oceanobacillus piezotolerans]RLL47855.1 aminopeptidase P family protein [Oceanobacillus piezotolerans]
MASRISELLNVLKKENIDGALITSTANFYYLSNYYTEPHERVIAVYVSHYMDPVMLLPAMEVQDARQCGWNYEIISYYDHENPWELLKLYLGKNNEIIHSIAIEKDHITLDRYEEIKKTFPNVEVFDAKELISNLRVIKTKSEYKLLKEAARLADFGVETAVNAIYDGITELELVARIEYELKKQGVTQMSFSTMALSGKKTASPHGSPSDKKVGAGDFVLFDLGVVYEGYCSDITRTVGLKTLTEKQKNIYHTVLQAEEAAISQSVIDTPVGKLDAVSREIITKAGYSDYFPHRIGHGLGIETHEYPSMHANNPLLIKPGMCFTIEPGIYVPEIGGVRIEDMIFTTNDGPEVLTSFPKELIIV